MTGKQDTMHAAASNHAEPAPADSTANERLKELQATVDQLRESRSAYVNLVEDLNLEIETRRKTEDALRQSEEKFRTIANYTADWESWFGTDGKYLWVNPAVQQLTGHSAEEVLAMPDFIGVMIAEQDRAMVTERFQGALRGSRGANLEFQYLHKNGSPRWLNVSWQPIFDAHGKSLGVRASGRDITERKQAEAYRDMGLDILHVLNEPGDLRDSIRAALATLKARTGFDAVGLRLQEGDDFPYFAQEGFTADFMRTENTLLGRGADGKVCRDSAGNVCLECTCGLVISGTSDPSRPVLTRGGSFWTNDSVPLHELPPGQDPRLRPRNECAHQGYASVALIPIKDKRRVIGLLHLSDRRSGCFTLATVELLEGIAAHIGAALMRKQAEDRLRRDEARFRSLANLLQYRGQNTQDFLDFALSQALELTDSKLGYIYFYHEDRKQFVLNTWSKDVMKECSVANPETCYELDKTGIWGEAVRQRRPILLNDFQAAHPLKKGMPEGHAKLNRYLTVPVFSDDRIVAVVAVANKDCDYDDADIRQLRMLMDAVWKVVERTQAEEALLKSEREFRSLAESMPQIVWITRPDGWNIYFNQQWMEYTGLTLEESCGHGWNKPFHPDDRQRAWHAWLNATQKDVPYSLECRLRRADGVYRWWLIRGVPLRDTDGTIIKWFGTCTDIDDIKQAEAGLRQSEARFRSYFDLPLHGIAITSPEKGWLTVNAKLCSMLGYTQEELTRTTWTELTHPDDLAADIERFEQMLSGQIEQYQLEKRFIRKDGKIIYTRLAVGCVRESDGKVTYIIALLDDITERKRAEAELQKIDKLQSVGTLAGGIAHDFNNILLGLFGNISLAKADLPREHPSYASLEEAEKSMGRAVRLTKQLLTFAKGGDPVKEDIGLGELVEEVARFDLSGSSIKLVYHQSEDLWPVDADKGQIQQVISNLVINARQAMPDGGRLTVTLENTDLPEPPVPSLRQGRYVKATIRDEGTGIDPAFLDRIFDPYFTTKQSGNGLGLATVWSIINKHGGHIGVVSELGKGSTFTFYLPASRTLLQAAPKAPVAESRESSRPAKILVMDDEDTVCRLVGRMLAPQGYTVATVHDGREAIALYKQALEAGEPFDAVIMDLTIPGGTGGKEAIKGLLAIDPGVTAIVSSGYAGDPVLANFADYGFKGIATKPYTQRELREVVARVLA